MVLYRISSTMLSFEFYNYPPPIKKRKEKRNVPQLPSFERRGCCFDLSIRILDLARSLSDEVQTVFGGSFQSRCSKVCGSVFAVPSTNVELSKISIRTRLRKGVGRERNVLWHDRAVLTCKFVINGTDLSYVISFYVEMCCKMTGNSIPLR